MSIDKNAMKVLEEYQSKFNRLPDQPHHLIAFSKSRSDLPTLNYGKARSAIQAAKSKNSEEGKGRPKGKGKAKGKVKGGEGSKPEKKAKRGEGSKQKVAARPVPKINNGKDNKKKKNDQKQNDGKGKGKGKGKDVGNKRVARGSVESPQSVNEKKKNKSKDKNKNKNKKDKGGVVSESINAKPSQIKALRQQQENEAKAEELPIDEANDLQIAQEKDLPSSPKLNGAQKFPQEVVDNFGMNDEGGGAMAEGGVLSDDDDDDDDDDEEFYKDGNETTAPGLLAQVRHLIPPQPL